VCTFVFLLHQLSFNMILTTNPSYHMRMSQDAPFHPPIFSPSGFVSGMSGSLPLYCCTSPISNLVSHNRLGDQWFHMYSRNWAETHALVGTRSPFPHHSPPPSSSLPESVVFKYPSSPWSACIAPCNQILPPLLPHPRDRQLCFLLLLHCPLSFGLAAFSTPWPRWGCKLQLIHHLGTIEIYHDQHPCQTSMDLLPTPFASPRPNERWTWSDFHQDPWS
jgi:hypothetical protein